MEEGDGTGQAGHPRPTHHPVQLYTDPDKCYCFCFWSVSVMQHP